jgi:hypothetical protein
MSDTQKEYKQRERERERVCVCVNMRNVNGESVKRRYIKRKENNL